MHDGNDIIFVIPADQTPSTVRATLLDEAQARGGGRTTVDYITADSDSVRVPGGNIGGNGCECGEVAMNIGENGDFHTFPGDTSDAILCIVP
jgi:hypothetical protein